MAKASGFALHGRLIFQGLKISIENRRGSWREDKHDPPRWRTKMKCDYGYIQMTEGVDGDHHDVFIGPNPNAKYAYVVNQMTPRTGKFDEQKTMLGFDSMEEAKRMYLAHYDTPKFFGSIRQMPMAEFKRKVLNSLHGERLIKSVGHLTQPFNSRAKLHDLWKGMVDGHFRHGPTGKPIWIPAYEDKRIETQRPKNEQKPRKGDSMVLFPEIGFVRPIPEKKKAKVEVKPEPTLSMFDAPAFSGFKSVDSRINSGDEPAVTSGTGAIGLDGIDEKSLVGTAFMLALQHAIKNEQSPRVVLADARRRVEQAKTLARVLYSGTTGADSYAPCLAAMKMSPTEFAFAIKGYTTQANTFTPLPQQCIPQSAPVATLSTTPLPDEIPI